MANTKSALKRIRISEKRHLRNQAVKSSTRTYVKKARAASAANVGEAQADIVAAISALDVAARKGVIHPNNASRRKSRLVKRYNEAMRAAAPAPVVDEPVAAEPVAEAKPKRTRRTTPKA